MQDLYLNGTHEGLRCCVDVNNISIGLVAKLNLISMKKFLSYLQVRNMKSKHFEKKLLTSILGRNAN